MKTVQEFQTVVDDGNYRLEIRERERRPRGQDLIFSHILTKISIVLFFTRRVSAVVFIERG